MFESYNSFRNRIDFCLVQCRVNWGPAANFVLQTGHRTLDELLTCQKFWSADSSTCAVEAEPRADSTTAVLAALMRGDLSDSNCTTRTFSADIVSYHFNDKPHRLVFQAVHESMWASTSLGFSKHHSTNLPC